jgi:hypothetical protein
MKQLDRCKDCEFYNPKCPFYIEDCLDVDDGVQKLVKTRDVLVHVPGCEFGDDPVAFELMDECPLEEGCGYAT